MDFRKRWVESGDFIIKEYKVANYRAAIRFVDRIAEMAMNENHLPDILLHSSNKVKIKLSTKEKGKVTDRDHKIAGCIDGIYNSSFSYT